MIPPSLPSVGLLYYAQAVWVLEAVPPDAPDGDARSCAAGDAANDAAGDVPLAASALTTMHWVFKGYEWRLASDWNCLPNPDYERGVDGKRDEDADAARNRERARRAAPPLLPAAVPATRGGSAATGEAGAASPLPE